MEYFLIRCIYECKEFFAIWYTDEKDGFYSRDKKILCFTNIDNALQYSLQNGIVIKDESIPTYDFNQLVNWLNSDNNEVDCNNILDFWNIFMDAAFTTKLKFIGNEKDEETSIIYEKLFYGCNIFVRIRKQDGEEEYIPIWDRDEIKLLKSVLENGLNLFIEGSVSYRMGKN